ncbi:hypothetical protein GF420_13525 [candidate division GN15 bacterium]|nr:hypothetical protein [candidate division GN15 bacterium]
MIRGEQPVLPAPPSPSSYPETPANNQHALMLVLGDLLEMDHLTFFSLLFAIVIDLIVIVMAMAGSLMSDNMSLMMDRVERDGLKRIRRASLEEPAELEAMLERNLDRVKIAGRYGIDLQTAINDFTEKKRRLELHRGPEEARSDDALPSMNDLVRERETNLRW